MCLQNSITTKQIGRTSFEPSSSSSASLNELMISGGVYGDAEQMRTALLLFFDKTRPDMSKGIADVVVFSRYECYDLRSVFKLARRKTIHSTIITLLTGKIGGAPD